MKEIGLADPELKVFLNIIDSSIKKFRALINDISTIAKLESKTIMMEKIVLNEIINEIEWSLDDKIKSAEAVINRALDVEKIFFSKKNLGSVLFNLISNAIKFRRDQPPIINIQTKREDNHMILSVEDNGIGIVERDLDKVFSKYGRLKSDIEGQGIGLYLAKKIVDSAGGNIVIESEPGKSSRFIVYLQVEPKSSK